MTITLREYQERTLDEARRLFRQGKKRLLIVAPTGSGKTILAAKMIGDAAEKGHRSFFTCPRIEILDQTSEAFSAAGIPHGIIAAGYKADTNQLVQICSIQTLYRRLGSLPIPHFVICDEAASSPAQTWQHVLNTWPEAYRIGLTATPYRLDGSGFEGLFDEIVEGASVSDLIQQGWLAPFRVFGPPGVDTSGLQVKMGDFVPAQAEGRVFRPEITGDAIRHYKRLTDGQQAIAFCATVRHSQGVAKAFREAGIPAAHLDSSSNSVERTEAIQAFRAGDIRVLCNVDIVTEGFNVPSAAVAILLRPTMSLGRHLQMIGRVLRPAPGKTAIIIDHVGNTERLGLPDEPYEWTLQGRKKRHREADTFPVRICPKCYGAFRPAPTCPYCGAKAELSVREIKQREGELVEIQREAAERERKMERQAQGRAQSLSELQEIGRRRGYAPGWAWNVYQARSRKQAHA